MLKWHLGYHLLMECREHPLLPKRSLLVAAQPGMIGRSDAPLRTLKRRGLISDGVDLQLRAGRGGQLAGRLRLYSSLNRDAARFNRLGFLEAAETAALEAADLEASETVMTIMTLLSEIDQPVHVIDGWQAFLHALASPAMYDAVTELALATDERREDLALPTLHRLVGGRVSNLDREHAQLITEDGQPLWLRRQALQAVEADWLGAAVVIHIEEHEQLTIIEVEPAILDLTVANPELDPANPVLPMPDPPVFPTPFPTPLPNIPQPFIGEPIVVPQPFPGQPFPGQPFGPIYPGGGWTDPVLTVPDPLWDTGIQTTPPWDPGAHTAPNAPLWTPMTTDPPLAAEAMGTDTTLAHDAMTWNADPLAEGIQIMNHFQALTAPTPAPETALNEQQAPADIAAHPLIRLGHSAETIEHFQLGYQGEQVLVPLNDRAGQPLGWATYQPTGNAPRWHYMTGSVLRELLYHEAGARQALIDGATTVFVVEGFRDAWALWQAGHQAVVALGSAAISLAQGERLAKLAWQFAVPLVIWPDADLIAAQVRANWITPLERGQARLPELPEQASITIEQVNSWARWATNDLETTAPDEWMDAAAIAQSAGYQLLADIADQDRQPFGM